MKMHPFARLQDYYKLFYQAVFGPAHILSDKNSAYQYLKTEIALSKSKEIQSIALDDNDFIRVGLGLIEDVNKFFEVLWESAKKAKKISNTEWFNLWNKIATEIEKTDIKNFKEDSKKIKEFLLDGKFIFHHSEIYKEKYHPHYRVVSRKLWENI